MATNGKAECSYDNGETAKSFHYDNGNMGYNQGVRPVKSHCFVSLSPMGLP